MEIRRRKSKPIKPIKKKQRKPGSGRKKGLTRQQKVFIHEYLSSDTLDVVQAYDRAGYKGKEKYKVLLANQALRNPNVRNEIDRILDMRLESKQIDAYYIDWKLKQITDFDLRGCYNRDGSLKNVHELDDNTIAALASIESEELFAGRGEDRAQIGYTRKVKAWDKLKAIELMARRRGMFTDKVQLEGGLNVKAGVIVIPVPPESQEEWLRRLKDNYQKQRVMEKELVGE